MDSIREPVQRKTCSKMDYVTEHFYEIIIWEIMKVRILKKGLIWATTLSQHAVDAQKRHLRIGTPYKWEFCHKAFVQLNSLNSHTKMHEWGKQTQEKDFESLSSSVTRLKQYFVKPYDYVKCNKTFHRPIEKEFRDTATIFAICQYRPQMIVFVSYLLLYI